MVILGAWVAVSNLGRYFEKKLNLTQKEVPGYLTLEVSPASKGNPKLLGD